MKTPSAPKPAARRSSKKSTAAAATTTTTTTTTHDNGVHGQADQVAASVDGHATATASPSASPQENQIAERAYQIWLESGQPEGLDEENWHQAQRELSGNARPRL